MEKSIAEQWIEAGIDPCLQNVLVYRLEKTCNDCDYKKYCLPWRQGVLKPSHRFRCPVVVDEIEEEK